MTFLDAYALIAFLADESAAAQVQEILEEGDAAVPSVNLAEATRMQSGMETAHRLGS